MHTMGKIFPVVILNARPGAGKSEIIDYLRRTDTDERIRRFHIGSMREIDDFPMLWTWFEEDAILEKMGLDRLHTTGEGYFTHHGLWNLLIRRICLEYDKLLRDAPSLHTETTVIIEFSRGSEHGGYTDAYNHLSDTVMDSASLLYVDVSYEESLRKNRKRFNPDKPDSILEHGLSDDKLSRLYRDTDWDEMTKNNPELISLGSHRLPYAVFDNTDDLTTGGGEALGERLQNVLSRLWKIRLERQ
jgi:hypothetical protein